MIKIELIAIGKEKVYSVGLIQVSNQGDVYIIHKIAGTDLHTSRHKSGVTHWKSQDFKFHRNIRKGTPIQEFKGIEFIYSGLLTLDNLPDLFREYRREKCNGVFAFDIREYKNAAFNMAVAILTEEGFPTLLQNWKQLKKRQIYLYTNTQPMIAVIVADAKQDGISGKQ